LEKKNDEEQQKMNRTNSENMRKVRSYLTASDVQQRRTQDNLRNERQRFMHYELQNQGERTTVDFNLYTLDIDTPLIVDISSRVQNRSCIEKCHANLFKEQLTVGEADYVKEIPMYKSLVCIVCDCFITGRDEYNWISRDTLLYHKNILSYKYFYKDGINEVLKRQYYVGDPLLEDLLLSPRARRKRDCHSYMCCISCYEPLEEKKLQKKPPKYAISNGFAIGHMPESIAKNITPLVNNLVAPVRAFNFFVSFNGGKEQKITGNFTFFAQDVAQNIGALQHTSITSNNPSVFVVLLGSFTQRQLEKIRTEGSYSVETFREVYSFLHQNNYHYCTLPAVSNVPLPVIEQVRLNEEADSEEENPSNQGEEHIYWKYWFPASDEPNNVSGIYNNQCDFARALFVGETPTLFYHPTKIVSFAMLSQLLPIAFPFGTGDVDCKRRPAVNEVECLQHYLRLSLPCFQEGQSILIIHHMFQRRKSFLTGITKCNITNNGNTIADQIAAVTVEDLDIAINQIKRATGVKNTGESVEEPVNHHVNELLHCIKTSCVPIGYTNEAAAEARNKMFALWMTFGPPSLLFTFSPCDECSFRMKLHATANVLKLPSIHDSIEIISQEHFLWILTLSSLKK
jgi:hypothetical protein